MNRELEPRDCGRRSLRVPARVAPRDDLAVSDLGDQLVVLDPGSQAMFALDEVGRFVWSALSHAPLADVAAAVAERYRVPLATAEGDLNELVAQLAEAGLLRALVPAAPDP